MNGAASDQRLTLSRERVARFLAQLPDDGTQRVLDRVLAHRARQYGIPAAEVARVRELALTIRGR